MPFRTCGRLLNLDLVVLHAPFLELAFDLQPMSNGALDTSDGKILVRLVVEPVVTGSVV